MRNKEEDSRIVRVSPITFLNRTIFFLSSFINETVDSK